MSPTFLSLAFWENSPGTAPAFRHGDVTVVLLVSLFSLVVLTSLVIMFFVVRHLHGKRLVEVARMRPVMPRDFLAPTLEAPSRWLAIRTTNPHAIQEALGVYNARLCSWRDALAPPFEPRLFISPPVDGWVLVIGCDLPDFADDVDRCFRFLTALSRKLGQVQYFGTDRFANHHAWVRVNYGAVSRGYAWAGETLWNQGACTHAERALGLRCFDYTQSATGWELNGRSAIRSNTERVPRLAGIWSVNPTIADLFLQESRPGIAGALFHSKQ